MVARIKGNPPTEWIEKIGSVYLVERHGFKTYTAYCEKYGVWKSDLSAVTVNTGRRNGSMSALQWPERAYNEVGKTYWDNLTILEIDFRSREKPYKGGTRIVMDAIALCHCAKFNLDGWIPLESIRTGKSKTLSSVPHKPDDFCVSPEHDGYFADKTVSAMVNGYHGFTIDRTLVYVHRMVWTLKYGDIPDGFYVDHINRNRHDNRIENLRLVTPSENGQNKNKTTKPVTSKQKGVYFHAGKWWADCKVGTKRKQASFHDEVSAIKAVKSFYDELNREHGCLFSGH